MRLRDTDYVYATMRVRANEKNLLTARDISRMIDAKTPEEAAKVLADAGYGDFEARSFSDVERAISDAHEETIKLIDDVCENTHIAKVFKLKYDFHNIKTVIKADFSGENPERLMSDSGSIGKDVILTAARKDDFGALPQKLQKALLEARETISHTGDARLSDFILDRAYFEMMAEEAEASGSEFLRGYVRLLADTANLRSAVRTARQKKGAELLREALIPGGNIPQEKFLSFDFENGFSGTALSEAAAKGALSAKGERGLLEFERELDNAAIEYMRAAKYVAFDERPIVAYIAAREAEATTVRIIMAGKLEGLSAEEIQSRLRVL